jgi:hypothetical protein
MQGGLPTEKVQDLTDSCACGACVRLTTRVSALQLSASAAKAAAQKTREVQRMADRRRAELENTLMTEVRPLSSIMTSTCAGAVSARRMPIRRRPPGALPASRCHEVAVLAVVYLARDVLSLVCRGRMTFSAASAEVVGRPLTLVPTELAQHARCCVEVPCSSVPFKEHQQYNASPLQYNSRRGVLVRSRSGHD